MHDFNLYAGEEAKNPKRNIPLAIIASLFIIFLSNFGMATVLTMVLPYYEQVKKSFIKSAFTHARFISVPHLIHKYYF